MSIARRTRVGWLVAAALLTGLIGPCVCGPVLAAMPGAACCDTTEGLKPAPPECCADCSASIKVRESIVVRSAPPAAILDLARGADGFVLRPLARPPSPRRPPLPVVAVSPPILRV